MEQVCKRQKRDFDEVTLEELPDEIILKIFSSVNIRDLFQCMAVNKKIREIANDQTLWNIMHLNGNDYENDLPAELLPRILEKGCQYLSLFNCGIKAGKVRFANNFQLKYLSLHPESDESNDITLNVMPNLVASCHNLEKLCIKRLDIFYPEISHMEVKFFKCIIQNSETLKVLDLSQTHLSLASVQRIFLLCQHLLELNISADHCLPTFNTRLCPHSVDFLCNNLTATIEKLDISDQHNFADDQFKILIERCNRITELSFVGTNVTDDSMNTIVETLYESQVKLRPGLFSLRKKLKLASHLSDKERGELRKRSPYMKHEYFDGGYHLAEPYPDFDSNDEEAELVPNGFWDIKAKLRTYN